MSMSGTEASGRQTGSQMLAAGWKPRNKDLYYE